MPEGVAPTSIRYRWLVLVPIALLYIWSAPRTVQDLDSGELVASALTLTLAHPPGYPLYTWLLHALIGVMPATSPYHGAALWTCIFMVSAMALLLRLTRTWLGVALVVGLATTPLIWLYAVTPDVFALHLLLTAALVMLVFAAPCARRTLLAGIVFGLGAANHHTTVFLAPLLALIVWEEKRNRVRLAALVSGFMVSVIAYASLGLLDTAHYYAWREIKGPADILHVFLRRDYGTLRLSGRGGEVSLMHMTNVFFHSSGVIGAVACACVIVGGVVMLRQRSHRAWWALALCLVAYCVVLFPRLVIQDVGLGPVIIQRFFLFPMLLLGALAVIATDALYPSLRSSLRASLVVLFVGLAGLQVYVADVPDLRNDTVIEDWARNILTVAREPGTPSILLVSSDTQLYATRYVQAVDPAFESVTVVARGMLFEDEGMRKLQKRLPNLHASFDPNHHDLFADFLVPNAARYPVTSVLPINSPHARSVYYPVGRRIEPGTGTAIADNPPPLTLHAPRYLADTAEWTETKALYAQYAIYNLARSQQLIARGDVREAKNLLSQTLTWMPYCVTCKRNACALETEPTAKQECLTELARLEANETDYLR